MFHSRYKPLTSGGNQYNFSKLIIRQASDSINDSESICISSIKFAMTSLNNNKTHLKIFNYHIKIVTIVRYYDISQFMIL